jgi:uncharacterized membrane protein YkoI
MVPLLNFTSYDDLTAPVTVIIGFEIDSRTASVTDIHSAPFAASLAATPRTWEHLLLYWLMFTNTESHQNMQKNQAITIATKNTSAQAPYVRSVTLDNENGQLVSSVEITKANSQPTDVIVDSINGKVLRVDQGLDGAE